MKRVFRLPLGAALMVMLGTGCQPEGGGPEGGGAAPQTAPGIVPAAVPPRPGTNTTGIAPDPLPMDTVGRMRTPGLGTDTAAPPPR